MRRFLIYFIHILVLIKGFNTQQDYGKDGNEYSDEDSESVSNEVVTKCPKGDAAIINATETVTQKTIVPEVTEQFTESNTLNYTGKVTPCRNTARAEKSEEDRSSTTLINYPFSVSIQRKGAHYATGALVDKRWILSSAGEFYNVRESIKLLRARLGSVDCKKGGTLVPLKRVEIHPSYIYGQPNFDLALLRMALPVDYTDFIRPIGLSSIRTRVISAKFMTTYWPRLIVNGKVLPTTAQERIKQNSMRVSTQRLIPSDKCLVMMQIRNTTLDESTLCLKPFVTHHSVCMPDSGAPVVAEDGLWGITSGWTSTDCLSNPSPTVFSRISSLGVRAWVDTQLLNIL